MGVDLNFSKDVSQTMSWQGLSREKGQVLREFWEKAELNKKLTDYFMFCFPVYYPIVSWLSLDSNPQGCGIEGHRAEYSSYWS